MEYFVVCLVALLASGMTLFSGFGLGTVLMPAFALFFPLPVAIAATAVVHLAGNLFKVGLVGRNADWSVVVRFAIPAALAAFVGAVLLNVFAGAEPLVTYAMAGRMFDVTLLKLIIGGVIVLFAIIELWPAFNALQFDRKYLPVGGLLSGFFGGLSGNQGALRSAFLIKAGLTKEAFIGTGAVSTVIVDTARLLVYGVGFYSAHFAGVSDIWGLVLAATLAAFAGAFIGSRLVEKITLKTIQVLVGALLVLIGMGLMAGVI
jgi:uncharacterized membrane protein YfcA